MASCRPVCGFRLDSPPDSTCRRCLTLIRHQRHDDGARWPWRHGSIDSLPLGRYHFSLMPSAQRPPCALTRLRILGFALAAFALLLSCAAICRAQNSQDILPLDQVKPGMKGYAYTIFAGDQIERFDLVVIGVMPNFIGPKQSIILVQLEGPKVEHTGVVAGMSGSPVYIEGKLAGALSLKLGIFTKEPLAGVTPIEDMFALRLDNAVTTAAAAAPESAPSRLPLPAEIARNVQVPSNAYLQPIQSPLTFSGFLPEAVQRFAGEFERYSMVATQGGTAPAQPDDAKITPGDMAGMVLVQGDVSISAACTVAAVRGDRVFLCGHPLFGFGSVQLPMARSRVLTTL